MKNYILDFVKSYLDNISPLNETNKERLLDYHYLDSGHIDSFGIIHFILDLEQEFDISFSPEETESEEFRTIRGIINIINAKKES